METLNTLNFISKAKRIDVRPKMNFQTKSEGAKEKQISALLEKIQFLEHEKTVLLSENENLKVKLKMEKQKESSEMKEKESTIQNLKQKISVLEERRLSVDGDLDKTVVVKSKRFAERKSKGASDVMFSYNHLQPKLRREKKRGPNADSGVYTSSGKDNLCFLKTFNKSFDFGTQIEVLKIRRQILAEIGAGQAQGGRLETSRLQNQAQDVLFGNEEKADDQENQRQGRNEEKCGGQLYEGDESAGKEKELAADFFQNDPEQGPIFQRAEALQKGKTGRVTGQGEREEQAETESDPVPRNGARETLE